MKYLVTGGAGFIGSNITKQLLADGHDVVVFDNFSAGKKDDRIQEKATYIKGDIRDLAALQEAMNGIDGVFHLAAVPRVPYSVEHPDLTNEHNTTGTVNVLVAARDNGVKRVVFSSSSSVYGNEEVGIALTEDMPKKPLSPYALQKLAGQEYCRLFASLYDIETVALCYFNIYGPLMDPEGGYALVIGKFLRQKMNGEPMTICGDGEYYRDYTHVTDVVRANILAMTKDTVGNGEMINIGNANPYSVNQLVEMIGGESTFVAERKGDPRYAKADNTRAKELLGWEPTVKLSEGIAELKQLWGVA